MKQTLGSFLAFVVCPGFALALSISEAVQAQTDHARGEYLATIMDCGGCHTTGALVGKPDPSGYLAGSEVGFQIPDVGVVYPPNLTPDDETGLGRWTEQEIIQAVRAGERPDGRMLAPVMPWPHYARLTDEDALALARYLKNLSAVRRQAPANTGPTEKPTAPYLTVVVP